MKSGWMVPKEAARMHRSMILQDGTKLFKAMKEKQQVMKPTA